MKNKNSLLLVIIMVCALILTACGNSDSNNEVEKPKEITEKEETQDVIEKNELEKIIDSGEIKFGTSAGYPPFEFHALVDGKDTIVGLDIEIAKYIADSLGVKLEIKDMDFDKLLGGLSTGMLDMVIAGMNPSPEREANFTDIYYEANLSVLIHKDYESEITKIEDLEGKSMAIQIGTTQETIAQEDIKDAVIKSLSQNSDIIMNLKTKKVDCTIMETPVAESFANVNDDLIVVKDLIIDSGSGGIAVALKKGNDELTEKLNEILSKIKSEGLIEKWLVEADKLSSDSL